MAQLVYASSERFITPIKSFYGNNMCLSGFLSLEQLIRNKWWIFGRVWDSGGPGFKHKLQTALP